MKKSAPQEVHTLDDLKDWEQAGRRVSPPIRLAVIGDPVAHSLSPKMQNAALRECGIDMQYGRFHLRANELEEAFQLIRQHDFVGFNVTLPHKERAHGLVDELDDEAQAVGAVNTIVVRDRKLLGFNTDGIGFARAIRGEFSVDLRDLRVLVLGAGGAARAIAFECARQDCERLVIANRTRARADQLVQGLQPFFAGPRVLGPVARLQAIELDEAGLRGQIPHTDLLVNATSVGLEPSDRPLINPRLLAPHLMVFDAVYGSSRTPLLLAAAEAGARGSDGFSMLVQQGARAFEIWFRREAPVEVMRAIVQ